MHMQSDTGKCTCELTRSTLCLASNFQSWKPDTAWNGSTHTCTYMYRLDVHLYDAPEDGCILHPKHVEQGKCNKVTLNNLHQAGSGFLTP